MAQLIRSSALDVFSGWFTSRPRRTHTKKFNCELIYLWCKISKLLKETSNLSLLYSKTKTGSKEAI